MNRIVLVVSLVAAALPYSEAMGQVRWYAGNRIGFGGYPGYGGYGGYGYGFGGGTTAASAAGHAMADVVRSQGAYNAMTSGAMVNVEEARGKYIENQKQWTEVYLMKQRAIAAQHSEQKEDARARNARIRETQGTQSSLPSRLSSSELDPATGHINWPSALMLNAFADQRKEIEGLFASRAHTGTTSDLSDAVYKKVRAMQDELRNHIRNIVTQDYLDARKFLDRLSLEGRFPVS